jgi:hypothetical protein
MYRLYSLLVVYIYISCDLLDLRRMVWSQPFTRGAPSPRSHATLASFADPRRPRPTAACDESGERSLLVVWGGARDGEPCDAKPYALDCAALLADDDDDDDAPANLAWRALRTARDSAPPPTARHAHASADLGTELLVCGGRDRRGQTLAIDDAKSLALVVADDDDGNDDDDDGDDDALEAAPRLAAPRRGQ